MDTDLCESCKSRPVERILKSKGKLAWKIGLCASCATDYRRENWSDVAKVETVKSGWGVR